MGQEAGGHDVLALRVRREEASVLRPELARAPRPSWSRRRARRAPPGRRAPPPARASWSVPACAATRSTNSSGPNVWACRASCIATLSPRGSWTQTLRDSPRVMRSASVASVARVARSASARPICARAAATAARIAARRGGVTRRPGHQLRSPTSEIRPGIEQRADEQRVDQDADHHQQRELAERAERDEGEQCEARRERDPGHRDRARGLRRRDRDGLAQAPRARLRPDPPGDEDVVVRAERDEQDGGRERHVVGEAVEAEQRPGRRTRSGRGRPRSRARSRRAGTPGRRARA